MFKRELKVNFKNFIIWTLILVGMFLIVFLIYPSIINSENIALMDEMMKMFPEELLKAFNMDINSINNVFGWLKSEGFVFILLLTGIYSSILGSNILLKEESDKTIEYLNSLPVKRKNILLSKIGAGVIYIILMVIIIAVFNYFGLLLSGEFDQKIYILLSITPIFSSLPIFFISLYMSTFFHKTKKTIGISLGFVLVSYFLQVLSGLSDKILWLKYFSVFTLADTRNVILNGTINLWIVIISISLSIIFLGLTLINYQQKELIN